MIKLKLKKYAALATLVLFIFSLYACGNVADNKTDDTSTAAVSENKFIWDTVAQPIWFKPPTEKELELAKADTISSDVILSTGPNGETAYPASKIEITEEQKEKIRAGHFKAAIAMATMGNDWATQQVAGMQDTFKDLGITVDALTDANFKDSLQITQIEAISATKPDVLMAYVCDAQTEAAVLKKVAASGTKIVFIDVPANDLVPGKDYVSVISADNFGNGMIAADELAKALNGKGDVAAIYFAANFYVTNQRYLGFVTRLQAKYPDINLVETVGFNDMNATQNIGSALLAKYPNLKSMWVAWSDPPAMGVVAAARAAGKTPDNFAIVTEDLNTAPALNIAQKSYIKGLGAQRPYDQGVAEAKVAALSLIGVEVSPYIAVPPLVVNRDNLAEAFQTVFHKPAPDNILEELKK